MKREEEGGMRYENRVVQFSLPSSQTLPSLPWLTLVTSDLLTSGHTSSHILLCDLGDEDLSSVMETVSTETKGVVLVNFSSFYEESLGRVLGNKTTPILPMLVVTGREGVELARLVREHPGRVKAGVGVAETGEPQSLETERRGSSE